MGKNNVVFLEVIEWFDDGGQELVHRIPEAGSGEIKWGAQLTVRESQAAVFFYNGKAIEVFGPGRHTLKTHNIPLLTKLLSLPWGLHSPLRAEIYMVNVKTFTDLRWGTRDPVAFRDSTLGLVRLRAHGAFNLRVVQPLLFINRMVGTMGLFSTAHIEEYLRKVIVSRFNDHLGSELDTLLNLPGKYDTMSERLRANLAEDFSHFGLALSQLYITSITPPPEVQAAIDERARMNAIGNLDDFVKMKAAMAMEKAAAHPGGGEGMGLGLGFMMPALFAQSWQPGRTTGSGPSGSAAAPPAAGGAATTGTVTPATPALTCPECQHGITADARFCAACGYQLVVFDQCQSCHQNLPPGARFCPSCGLPTGARPAPVLCGKCQAENLPGSVFCNQCGERI